MPEDLEVQIDELVAYLGAAGVASYCGEGVEADDYIACVARRAARAGVNVVIASSDKDFMQLVSPESSAQSPESKLVSPNRGLETQDSGLSTGKIGLLNPNDKTETVWSAEQVRAKTGVSPVQIVDWLALIGDAVDNIPGVPGVGPKTAADLLNQFGSVEQLYGQLDAIKSDRVRIALQSAAQTVKRNIALVRLQDGLACELELDDLVGKPANYDMLHEMFARWGFRSMLAELESSRPAVTPFRGERVEVVSESVQEILL
jgi:DNA polymerase-1